LLKSFLELMQGCNILLCLPFAFLQALLVQVSTRCELLFVYLAQHDRQNQ
jgi:hypothetical protein